VPNYKPNRTVLSKVFEGLKFDNYPVPELVLESDDELDFDR